MLVKILIEALHYLLAPAIYYVFLQILELSKIFVLLSKFLCCSQNFCVFLCIVYFVSLCVLLVCKCVLYNCHRVANQLQLTNIYQYMFNSAALFVSVVVCRY